MKIMKKITCTILALILFCFTLTGCGSSSKNVDGYYSYTHIYYSFYLKIEGSKAEYYTNSLNKATESGDFHHQYIGNAEKSDGGKKLYFQDEMSNYSPLNVALSEDGNTLYVSSESDSEHWGGTLSFQKMDKKAWEDVMSNLRYQENHD